MIDPTFNNINMLLVLSFKNDDSDPRGDSYGKYLLHAITINKSFNALINNKPFLINP